MFETRQMYRNLPVIALITARGGSKGIPRKNIRDLNGLPMMAYSIRAGLECPTVDRVVVSSDDREILSVGERFGAESLLRPAALATDESSSDIVIDHAFQQLVEKNDGDCYMVLLQPTSPLRDADDIAAAFSLMDAADSNNLISVCPARDHPYYAFVESGDGTLVKACSTDRVYRRRQDLPRAYVPNGAIYIFTRSRFQSTGAIPSHAPVPYVMPLEKSLDVDTPEDLEVVRSIMRSGHEGR
ncbi:MAG: acylneuraminate cytidylyltransferase family protein [Gammaproteobacteria bacterium]|nr:acylneuraminate cytidylyltransferase family protein [Gammaproteobacteria bacterium]